MKFELDALPMPRFGTTWVVLHQRLANLSQASRAYTTALLLDPHRPRTCNNLALLELGRLNADESERWVLRGLACEPLQLDEEELLQATACELRLFQLGLTLHLSSRRAATRAP